MNEERLYNFSAGPSMMPVPVLEKIREELMCYPGAGASVLEMSHRSKSFDDIIDGAKASIAKVMEVPEDYDILFMQGGATLQFACVALNLAAEGDKAAYVDTGSFANKAMKEAGRWLNTQCVASSKPDTYCYIPEITADMIDKDAKYLHITGNNTIYGTTYNKLPEHGNIPLVADWSSAILGKVIDVKAHDLIYAGAQKNMGPSGMAVVIAKKSVLEKECAKTVPIMLQYKIAMENNSMYNTPPCFSIYIAGLMAQWVESMGGVEAMEKINKEKAGMLYDFIDNSSVFQSPVRVQDRSITNVTFTLKDDSLTDEFLAMSKKRGMINLKGHRSVGGCRASIYNGMPVEGVKHLLECMKDFEMGKRD